MKLYKYKFKIKVPEGNDICDICDGFGSISAKTVEKDPIPGKDYRIKKCEQCKGVGYLTWIEKVFGKKV